MSRKKVKKIEVSLKEGEKRRIKKPVVPEQNQRIHDIIEHVLFINDVVIAKKLGFDKSYISQIKNGIVPVSKSFLRKFCAAYGVNPEWIMKGIGEPFFDKTPADKIKETFSRYAAESPPQTLTPELPSIANQLKIIPVHKSINSPAVIDNLYIYTSMLPPSAYNKPLLAFEFISSRISIDPEHAGNYIAIVDVTERIINDLVGHLVAFQSNNDIFVRAVKKIGNRHILVSIFNSGDEPIPAKSVDILGKVVLVIRRAID